MFKDIDMKDYNLNFELQRSYFLYDCLFEEISFVLEDVDNGPDIYPRISKDKLIIYKKSNNGISEKISLDELIFYIHTEVADEIKYPAPNINGYKNPKYEFYNIFSSIDNIKKAVYNMKIILKYDININKKEESEEEDVKETDEEKPLMTIV